MATWPWQDIQQCKGCSSLQYWTCGTDHDHAYGFGRFPQVSREVYVGGARRSLLWPSPSGQPCPAANHARQLISSSLSLPTSNLWIDHDCLQCRDFIPYRGHDSGMTNGTCCLPLQTQLAILEQSKKWYLDETLHILTRALPATTHFHVQMISGGGLSSLCYGFWF